MNKMLILNLSQRLNSMIKYFNRNRIFVRACVSKRNRYQELSLTATNIPNIICMTKRVLRVNILVVEVTVGLPKCRKGYGNGGLIVAATKTRVFSNTSKVMFRKCEVIQRRGLTTYNLGMGHKKLVQDLDNKFYKDKICNPERLIQAYKLVSKSKGSNTKGIDSETLDSYSKDTICSVSKSLKEILKLEKIRAKYPSKIQGSGYQVYYVRYADDFLIGINGPRRIAEELKKELQAFLLDELKLILNSEKTKITRSDKGAYFLGARLKCHTSRTNDQKRRTNLITKAGRKVRARVSQGRIIALVPLQHLIKKLQSQGICKIRNIRKYNVIPTRKTAWINLDLITIIKKYNEVWQGLLDYYSFAYNRCQLNYIQYLLHHSLACTFMNKLKLNSQRQVFKKYGKTIQIPNDRGKLVAFRLVKDLPRIEKFSNSILLSGFETFKYSLRTRSVFDKPCKICGTKRNIEMHHRRPLKAYKTDNTLKGIQINQSRKQIPLCTSCHQRVHNGLYVGPGIY